MAEKTPARCHCGGEVVYANGSFKCSSCGVEWITNREKHDFYQDRRVEILAAVRSSGQGDVRRAWHIPSSTLSLLVKKWELELPESTDPEPELVLTGEPVKIITITDHDLLRLGSDQFDQAWRMLGLIIRARVKHRDRR